MWVKEFLIYLEAERNYSARTIGNYGADLRAFETFFTTLDSELTWSTVDADVIRQWVVTMMDGKVGKAMQPTTVNAKLSSLRSFYRFLLRRDYVTVNPARNIVGPKKKKALPFFLRESEMEQLLEGEGMFGDDFGGVRDKLVIELFYSTGMREAELMGLKDSDIDYGTSVIKVLGKRNKQRLIPFGETLRQSMQRYTEMKRERFGENLDGAFIVDDKGKRPSRARIYIIVKENLSKVTTLKKRSPHVLRHTFATSMLNNKAELGAVKELLGHASLKATEIYTHTTFEELKAIYEQAHPHSDD